MKVIFEEVMVTDVIICGDVIAFKNGLENIETKE